MYIKTRLVNGRYISEVQGITNPGEVIACSGLIKQRPRRNICVRYKQQSSMNSTFGNSGNTKIVLFNGGWERFPQAFAERYASCEPERIMFVKRNFDQVICNFIKQETH